MRFFADLHLHSHFSRATSGKMNVLEMSEYAEKKGVNLLGTGDFQHPEYLEELKEKLEPTSSGLFKHGSVHYVLQTEIANIYTHNGRGRKVHHVILVPDFETADKLQANLLKWGRIDYDGRPIFGKSSQELVKMVMGLNPLNEVIPAHIWTPWFSLFGANSGYDSIEECYGPQLEHIHALETGLSSDPEMNWRLSQLDDFTLLSNSDSHSPWPWRMGRECNVFNIQPSYKALIQAIRTGKGLEYTIEVDPAYGKYHWSGHRKCGLSFSPNQIREQGTLCPKCGKPLTIGVEQRVEELADRPLGFKPESAIPFKKLIPLSEIISKFLDKGVATKTVWGVYNSWLERFKTEFHLMLEASREEILSFDESVGGAILKVRDQQVIVKPGFDGEYGIPVFSGEMPSGASKIVDKSPQPNLKSFL